MTTIRRARCLRLVAPLLTIFVLSAAQAADDAERHVITSSTTNVRTDDFELEHSDLPDIKSPPWSVRKTTLHGGKQEGCELITVDNGEIVIRIIPTRGMSILDVRRGDLRLGWDSPVKEVVHPKHVNLESRGGLGWLEGFNEWMVRCGLEFAGGPGKDEFINNTGDKAEMDLTLHGKIGNIPASHVEVLIDREAPHRIRVRGVVHERSFYGPKIELATEISTVPGSDSLRIVDMVTNHGASDQEYQLLYHTNYGSPLLGAGAQLVAPIGAIAPMNGQAAKSIDDYAIYEGPTLGFVEQVYLIEPLADEKGNTLAVLRNRDADRAASIRWSTRELPYLTVWKNTAAAQDGYVTGLEPGSCFPFNRKVERRLGRVPKIAPGKTRRFALDFGLHSGREEVATVVADVEKIRGGREPKVSRRPPETGD